MKYNRMSEIAQEAQDCTTRIIDLCSELIEMDAHEDTRDPEAMEGKEEEICGEIEELFMCADAMRGNA